MADKPLPTVEQLRQLLRYEPDTGLLFWLPRGPEWFRNGFRTAEGEANVWNSKYADQEAGTPFATGYKYISVFKRRLLVHRVAWAIATGEWPYILDHIDGDPTNNRITNLKAGSQVENMRNARMWKHNRSGVTGVCMETRTGRWLARIKVRGKQIHLLSTDSFDDAVEARRAAEAEYGFSARHGR